MTKFAVLLREATSTIRTNPFTNEEVKQLAPAFTLQRVKHKLPLPCFIIL
jgi:hypothetical protein